MARKNNNIRRTPTLAQLQAKVKTADATVKKARSTLNTAMKKAAKK